MSGIHANIGIITYISKNEVFQMYEDCLPLKCLGQQTNSTPENNEMPQGNKMAKLRICMPRSWQAAAPVWFHRTNGQQREALCMWSNKHPSGTSRASDWNGPSVVLIQNFVRTRHSKGREKYLNHDEKLWTYYVPRHRNGFTQRCAPLHFAELTAPWRHQPPIFW